MKRSWIKKKSSNPTALCKDRIQSLLRELAIIRDGGCVLRKQVFWSQKMSKLIHSTGVAIPYECGGYTNDGKLILQYDHLNSREHNVSYANLDLGVIVCKGHHGWKHFTDNNKKTYDLVMRELIGPRRAKLWDRVEVDRKPYTFGFWEWSKIEMMLTQELKNANRSLPPQTFV